jgi:AcrR family transcriptional regulator/transposase-like protein
MTAVQGAGTGAAKPQTGPSDDECLDWLWRRRLSSDGTTASCPQCSRRRRFHRIRARRSFACDNCGHQLYPTAGTLFSRSSTPLPTWLRVADLLLESGGDVTAREIQRRFRLEYRTALRMKSRLTDALMDPEQAQMIGDAVAALLPSGRTASHGGRSGARARARMNRISAAACSVFAEKGFARARVADVAAACGESSAVIHYYFRSKDVLLQSAMMWTQEQGARRLRDLMRGSHAAVDRLEGLVDLALPTTEAIRNEYLLWLDAWSVSRGGQRFDEDQLFSGWHHAVVDVVRDGQASGVFSARRAPEDFGDVFVALADGLSFKVVQNYEEMPLARARELLWGFVRSELGLESQASRSTTTRKSS